MATLEIMWPEFLKPIRILGQTGTWGVTRAKYNTGAEIRRSFQDRNLKTLTFSVYLDPTDDEYKESLGFLNYICGGLNAVWFRFPHFSDRLFVQLGTGNGSLDTFSVKGYATGSPTVSPRVDSVPVSSSLSKSTINLLTAEQAECKASGFSIYGGGSPTSTPATNSSFPFALNECVEITASAVPKYIESGAGVISASPGEEYTATTQLSTNDAGRICSVGAVFYDSGGSPISPFPATVTLTIAGQKYLVSNTATAPSGTVSVGIWIGVNSGSVDVNDFVNAHACCLSQGDLAEIWHPDDMTRIMTLSSAPAIGEKVDALIPECTPIMYMVADNVSGNLNAIGAREVKVKLREVYRG